MTAIEQADGISEPLAQEVLDFLLFVRERRAPKTAGWPPRLFERTAGA